MTAQIVPKLTPKERFNTPDTSLRMIGKDPQTYGLGGGKLATFTASLQFILRPGFAFNQGYHVSLVPEDPSKYASGHMFGKAVREESVVATFPRPELPIELYEFESCPFCRKVREAVNVLDIDVKFFPCPKNGPTWRKQVKETTGKSQFPYMKDPNTGVEMFESDAIIKYLCDTYGDGTVPLPLRLGILTNISVSLAMIARVNRGTVYRPSRLPEKPLVLWSFEGSPFCKIAREALVELEIPHIHVTAGRGSPKRQVLFEKRGRFQAPYLEDPNKGVAMFESASIVQYLNDTYAIAE
ncbi:CPLD58 [Auxenochlorella protothecoides x Auxenochlorella symbiontica]